MAILELKGLSRRFGGIVATDDVTLAIDPGELRCLIGPNGAGKSTLFKLIVGLVRPERGQIIFDGHPITSMQAYRRARLGLSMKYQATRIFPTLTVEQNITIARSRSRKSADDDDMDWALEHLGLAGHRGVRADTLSYGQQHWLEMAMVLGNAPRVVLMDEPTAGMTPEETHETARFLRELNGRGPAVVVIEHDMGFVREIESSVTVLHRGRIFRQGQLSEIERDPDVQRIYLGESHG